MCLFAAGSHSVPVCEVIAVQETAEENQKSKKNVGKWHRVPRSPEESYQPPAFTGTVGQRCRSAVLMLICPHVMGAELRQGLFCPQMQIGKHLFTYCSFGHLPAEYIILRIAGAFVHGYLITG